MLHGGFQQFLGGGFDAAGQFGAGETLELAFAGGLDASTDGGGVLDLAFDGEFLLVDAGDFDVDVDAVEERAADAFLVAGDGGGGATALFDGVAVEAAGAPVRVAVGATF